MDERRATKRARVMYGATASLPSGRMASCVVRNFSEGGALVSFGGDTRLPDDIALTIERKGRSYQAHIVWWRDKDAGISFHASTAHLGRNDADLQEQLRISQKKTRQLKRRVRELLGEG